MKEKKYYDDKWFSQILLLLNNRKLDRAMKELANYLESYPYDTTARTRYASLLLGCGRIDEAEIIINETEFTKKTTNKVRYELLKLKIKILCYQNKYEECYKLFVENDNLFKNYLVDYYSHLVFFKTRLSLPIVEEEYYNSYTVEQLIAYSEESAIEHIKEHVDSFDTKETSFSSDFPVDEVYYKLRNILPIDTKWCRHSGMIKDIYIFRFDGSGRGYRKVTNYIKVVCIKDTNDIITMYPYHNDYNLPAIDINLKIDKEEDAPKVKRMSQIDKFNQRYSKN